MCEGYCLCLVECVEFVMSVEYLFTSWFVIHKVLIKLIFINEL